MREIGWLVRSQYYNQLCSSHHGLSPARLRTQAVLTFDPGRRQGPEDDDLDDGHRGELDDPGSSDDDHYQKENGETWLGGGGSR